MPIFGFNCTECGHNFEELLMNSARIEEVHCPDCGSRLVRKQLSKVAVTTNSSGERGSGYSAAACAPGGL